MKLSARDTIVEVNGTQIYIFKMLLADIAKLNEVISNNQIKIMDCDDEPRIRHTIPELKQFCQELNDKYYIHYME